MSTEQLPDGLQLAVNIIREAEWPEGAGWNPLDAVLNEHAQRLTLQHHACDLAQRVADLEAERDELIDQRDRGDAQNDLLLAELRQVNTERDELRARLAEIEAQEPVAISKAGNLFWAGNPQDWRGVDCSLFASPVPAQAVPESVDGLVSVFCYDEVLTFTFCDEAAADRFAGRFDPSVDSAEAPEHKA